MQALSEALEMEGYLKKMSELRGKLDNPLNMLEDDDFPADFEQRCEEFTRNMLGALTREQVREIEKTDPTRGIFADDPVEVATMEREARAYAKNYAEKELAKVKFEDFMRNVSQAPVTTHAVSEQMT